MRTVHRGLALFILIFALYLGVTGTLIQITDLRTLLGHATDSDPEKQAIREGLNGTSDFQVLDVADYSAPPLPTNFDYSAALARTLPAIRVSLGGAPLQYVELRNADGQPIVSAKSDGRLLHFNATSGDLLSEGVPTRAAGGTFGRSQRNTLKGLHRMTAIGDWTLAANILVGLSLCVMLLTGTAVYVKLLFARRRVKKFSLFWSAGGFWRDAHRALSVISAAFLLVVALSGTWLAIESFARPYMVERMRAMAAEGTLSEDLGSPLSDEHLPAMLTRTLISDRRARVDSLVRVLRLRVYGGMPQGIIITGETEARQLVFNANSGKRATLTERGYPPQPFPFGWQAHQIAKQVHRGDVIGMPGRWMDLFAGISLIYLTISGGIMYLELWQRRRRSGRGRLLWK